MQRGGVIGGLGALPSIVQQIPCNLRPQRRVPAGQLRGEKTLTAERQKVKVKFCGTALKVLWLTFRSAAYYYNKPFIVDHIVNLTVSIQCDIQV